MSPAGFGAAESDMVRELEWKSSIREQQPQRRGLEGNLSNNSASEI